jgi:hypothetical protein
MEMHITQTSGYIRMIPVAVGATPIENWTLVTIQDATGTRTKHVLGRVANEGIYSTALVEIDWKTLTAETSSGRMYELIGPPGRDYDAQWLMGMAHIVGGDLLLKNHLRSIMRLLRAMEKLNA